MMRALMLLWGATLFASFCEAQTICPFLNTATGGGILGAEVRVSVTPGNKNKDDATCEFIAESGEIKLRLEVATMGDWRKEFPAFLGQCGSDAVSLRGIGNSAIACSGAEKDGKLYDRILSRVRERSLLVYVESSKQRSALSLREKSTKAAEEIAGNLF